MFGFQKNKIKTDNTIVALKIAGLHCTSCAVNIDLTLEDIPGVIASHTNYAKSETKIEFDDNKTDLSTIKKEIISLGYSIES